MRDIRRMKPGPLNLITDVPGLLVGNATDEAVRTGVTVIACDRPMAAAADLRGGGVGVRETAALDPDHLVGKAHALVLTGGSVFGLAAADGVAAGLSARGVGLHITAGSPSIPIVPAAVLHDLANGGDKAWGLDPPYRRLGLEALEAAGRDFALGAVGAGRGARAGMVAGGLGSASLDLGGGLVVGALAAVNSVGGVFMPDGETFWAWPWEIGGEFGGRRPKADTPPAVDPVPDQSRLGLMGAVGANTTLAVVATSADLTTAECRRLAIMAQDGLARAIRPVHTPYDGDAVFALATGAVPLDPGRDRAWHVARLGSAAADCLARAVARGVWLARPGN